MQREPRTRYARRKVITTGFGEQLLDYIEGGPKLRKWYGQGERPTDGGGFPGDKKPDPKQPPPVDVPRDSILVTDADSPTGQAVVLQLILARQKVRALVRSAEATAKEYGAYVSPIAGDVSKAPAVIEALVGTRSVVVTGRLGPHLLSSALAAGVEHIVLPSLAGGKTGPFSFLGPDAVLREAQREADAAAAQIALTVVRAKAVSDRPGGDCGLSFIVGKGGSDSETDGGAGISGKGSSPGGVSDISREDLARVVVAALEYPPAKSIAITVVSSGPGEQDDWQDTLSSILTA